MAGTLREMMGRHAQAGRIAWIGLRPGRRAAMIAVPSAEIGPGGLDGDHGRPGKRAVTLVQGEHLRAIGAYLGHGPVAAETLRRNIVVEGLNLAALNGWTVAAGGAVLRITGICAPCSRMEEALGHGGYNAVRGHGGWCADVAAPGRVAVGDRVAPLAPPTDPA
jgi:MOSC domain-containing protein YiiM